MRDDDGAPHADLEAGECGPGARRRAVRARGEQPAVDRQHDKVTTKWRLSTERRGA